MLLLHDTSVSTLQEKLRNEGRISPSQLWSSAALHRTILNQLFRIVSPEELFKSFQSVFLSPSSAEKLLQNNGCSQVDGINKYDHFQSLVAKYLNPTAWVSGNSNAHCPSSSSSSSSRYSHDKNSSNNNSTGWVLFNALLIELETTRKMASSISRNVKSPNINHLRNSSYAQSIRMSGPITNRNHGSASSPEESDDSDSISKIIVISFLVKRVSTPLLQQLQLRLFCGKSDYETPPPLIQESKPVIIGEGLDKFTQYNINRDKKLNEDMGEDIEEKESRKSIKRRTKKMNKLAKINELNQNKSSPSKTTDEKPAHVIQHSTSSIGDNPNDSIIPNTLWHQKAVAYGSMVTSLQSSEKSARVSIRLIHSVGGAGLELLPSSSSTSFMTMRTIGIDTDDSVSACKNICDNFDGSDRYINNSGDIKYIDNGTGRNNHVDPGPKSTLSILRACCDDSAFLLIPMNQSDLKASELLLVKAMQRYKKNSTGSAGRNRFMDQSNSSN